MDNLEEIKKEIHDYLVKKGWNGEYYDLWYTDDDDSGWGMGIIDIDCEYFIDNKKGVEVFNDKKWDISNGECYDKYLLEFIGHVLRNYKIKEVWITSNNWKYKSTEWTYETINKIE